MTPNSTILTDLYAPVREELDRVERIFDDELFSHHPFIDQLCTRVRHYHGKMLRPALVLLSGQACGGVEDAHRTLAAVVELVHLATLVHDDVLDEADLRRRQATVNAAHDNKTAVLLGDYLISHAYHLCSSLDDQYAARAVGATTNTVCEGELMQVAQRHNPGLTEEGYFEIIRKKTASLTATCCVLGARYAGADEETVRAAQEFGLAAGMAFQIVDDLLDLTGDQADTGKTTGRDLAFGNATLPIIHCLATAPPSDRRRLQEAVGARSAASVDEVCTWLERTDSIEYANDCAQGFVQTALDRLSLLPGSAARDSLRAMTEFILHRHF